MSKFCTRCGAPTDANGKCTKCEELKTSHETSKNKIQKPDKSNNKNKKPTKADKTLTLSIRITASVLAVLTVAALTIGALVYFDVINIGFINDMFVSSGMKDVVLTTPEKATNPNQAETTTNSQQTAPPSSTPPDTSTPYQVTPIDADAYYQKYMTVSATTNVADSQTVRTESDVCDLFYGKGFNNISITTEYEIDGTYVDAYEISTYSSTPHPIYQATYISSAGVVWSFTEVNGTLIANPVSYNAGKDVPVIFSETGSMTTYDSKTNKFYTGVPKSDLAVLKTIASIDFATIDTLTNEGIDNL